jgi:hypothetical protein
MCLNATVTFLTQLLAFADTLYKSFSPAQLWLLTAQILDCICGSPKGRGAGNHDNGFLKVVTHCDLSCVIT